MKRRLLIVPILVALVAGAWWLAQRSTRVNDAQSALSGAEAESASATIPEVLASVGRDARGRDLSTTKPTSLFAELVETAKDLVSSDEGTTLYGFVRAPDGSPSPQANLSATDRFGVVVRARASDSGAYSIPALAAGPWWISTSSKRTEEAKTRIEISVGEREKRLDLRLVTQPSVLVRVVDREGTSITRIQLLAIATLTPPAMWIDEISGGLDNPLGVGQFLDASTPRHTVPEGYLGQLVLFEAPPLFVSLVWYQRVIVTQRVEADQKEVTFELPADALQPASLRARTVDGQTQAVVENPVAFLANNGMRMAKPTAGVFEWKNLPPGNYSIRAQAKGYGTTERRVLLELGASLDLGDVALEPEQWISGTVVDEEGNGAVVDLRFDRCSDEGEPFPHLGSIYVVASKESGEFRIGALSRGVYQVSSTQANGDTRLLRQIVDTRNGPVENLRLELMRGIPLVVRGRDADWRHVRYRIHGEGASGKERKLSAEAPQRIHLAPGAYEIEARGKDGMTRRIPIVLTNAPLELELP